MIEFGRLFIYLRQNTQKTKLKIFDWQQKLEIIICCSLDCFIQTSESADHHQKRGLNLPECEKFSSVKAYIYIQGKN